MKKDPIELITSFQMWDWGECWVIVDKFSKASIQCMIVYDKAYHGYIYLGSLYVPYDYRDIGIGLRLIKQVERIGRKRKMKYCYLFVEEKSWVKKWYNRLGYKKYQGKDEKHCYMRKKL